MKGLNKMDWVTIGQDIISNSISGIIVATVCGVAGWIIYSTGIKGKDRDQRASVRKNEIYIPLKYELLKLIDMEKNIWEDIRVSHIRNIVEKNDELVVEDVLYQKCEILLELIEQYNRINPYSVASNILCDRFTEKYGELYGATTHTETYYDSISKEEFIYESQDPEIISFSYLADCDKNIDQIFNCSQYEEYYDDMGWTSPLEDYLTDLFASCLPQKESLYKWIDLEKAKDPLLREKKITPARYMARNFDFMKLFEENVKIKDKTECFYKIQELAFSTYEDVVVKIRTIGKKYEVE